MVDTRDLKSLGLNLRAGSTPAPGTILFMNSFLSVVHSVIFYLQSSAVINNFCIGVANVNPQILFFRLSLQVTEPAGQINNIMAVYRMNNNHMEVSVQSFIRSKNRHIHNLI